MAKNIFHENSPETNLALAKKARKNTAPKDKYYVDVFRFSDGKLLYRIQSTTVQKLQTSMINHATNTTFEIGFSKIGEL